MENIWSSIIKLYKKSKQSLYFAFFLGVTTMLVTGFAYIGYNYTAPFIEANRIQKIEDSIELLYSKDDGYERNEFQEPNAYLQLNYDIINDIYEVLDDDGDLHVLIYDVTAQGRNGMVSALIAIDPYTDTVEAVTYYDHGETPNIGEKYTREDEIAKLLGQSISNVEVDVIANASTTWIAIEDMFNEIELHFVQEEVHIDG